MDINPEPDMAALGDEIALLLGPLVRDLQGGFRACADELGLTLGEAQAVWLLGAQRPSTKELAQRLGIDPANASTLVTRLERRGLVDRRAAPEDRRRRVISLTGDGQRARRSLGSCMARRGPTFGRLTREELVTYRDLLLRLHGRA
jgi:DNA-binding MarR family transcriptional regulator